MKILNHVTVKIGLICTVIISMLSTSCKEKGTHALTNTDSTAIYNAIAASKTFAFGKNRAVTKSGDSTKGGDLIDTALAKKMITAFSAEQDISNFPLKTLSGENLRGFYIRKEIFETLINAKGANGIRLMFAKLPDGGSKAYTLIIYGTKISTALKGGYDKNDPTMGVYEYIDPCPKNCGY